MTMRMLIKDGGIQPSDDVLALRMITMMVHTVAGGGGAILDDDILSPESEAGRS